MKRTLIALIVLLCAGAQAAGPKTMATLERAALNEPAIVSASSYNAASRLEILAFAQALLHSEALDAAQLQQRLNVKSLNSLSVERVRQRYWQHLLLNFHNAAPDAAFTLNELRALAAETQVAPARALFHQRYLDEQLRLAALFPAISSEIGTFSKAEITGETLPDGEFLLSFDDGPSAPGGNTDKLIATLRQHALNGVFFILGEKWQTRAGDRPAALATLYQGQCVGVHGWEHQSHSRWAEWQSSVLNSSARVKQDAAQSYVPLFRPPYGQRKADSAPFFARNNIQVMLWNIDSQDWSQQISAEQAADRVLTLMLLWRSGIILFHDIHSKAPVVIERLQPLLQPTGVRWIDCHHFATARLAS